MSEPQAQHALQVLLRRFAELTGAADTCVIGRSEPGSPAPWIVHGREGTDNGAVAAWLHLADQATSYGRVCHDPNTTRFAGGRLAVPIEIRGDAMGALCAGFDEELEHRDAAVLWIARAYAATMALCLDDARGLGRLLASSSIDGLTGCKTRDVLWRALADEVNRARRQREPLTCVFVDLDGFKHVNDTDGHLAGDAVLRAVGAALHANVRSYDTLARVGGDEFVLLLPGTDHAAGDALVERIRPAVADAALQITDVPLTASAGVASWRDGESGASLIERADRRLLKAKSVASLTG